ncbi:hypothetical protein FB45DRAFT_1056072 [Roridomyces roridus]|uniref:DUF1917-domain-containing protein n=1 Tax=Roridomyces roridus TaxID=1738132 RepID=A0AAD7C1U3_9AGAR|nr:hypothetical protein FB45DRAFT_1056072 [Roridomyces roridus]
MEPMDIDNLFNPFSTRADSRQLDETVDEFLSRLPPYPKNEQGWYWIANPHIGPEHYPQDEWRRVESLKSQGDALLGRYHGTPNAGKELEKEIVELARTTGVVVGKWMLFLQAHDVNNTWARIAHATANNRLGTSAAVATGSQDGGHCRLVCVYTRDFTDEADVQRVLRELDRMGLVPKGRGLQYKCDAYTHLDIYAGNEYGVHPSIYSSARMLR